MAGFRSRLQHGEMKRQRSDKLLNQIGMTFEQVIFGVPSAN
jgi:hypothetical protein